MAGTIVMSIRTYPQIQEVFKYMCLVEHLAGNQAFEMLVRDWQEKFEKANGKIKIPKNCTLSK